MIWFALLLVTVVVVITISQLRDEIRELRGRLGQLERRLADVLAQRQSARAPEPKPEPRPAAPSPAPLAFDRTRPIPLTCWEAEVPTLESAETPQGLFASGALPPPLGATSEAPPPPLFATTPAPPPVSFVLPRPPRPPPPAEPSVFERFCERFDWHKIDWELFMGVRLFAWIGGLALFLGVVFFVKYSFEHNWIPPWLRVAAGFATGLALITGGVLLVRRKQYVIPAQSLCATGTVILYATTYAGKSLYGLIDAGPAFLVMSAITVGAFLLAAQFDALVVAILGLCGGFLTPILVSTGQDNPLALFSYIALLDAGLVALALRKQWSFLTLLGALGTVAMQAGWVGKFFERENYYLGNKILIAFAVFLGFAALFGAALAWAKRGEQDDAWFSGAATLTAVTALLFAFYPLNFGAVGSRPWMIFSYLLLVDLGLLAVCWLDGQRCQALPLVAAIGTVVMEADWVAQYFASAGFDAGGKLLGAMGIFLGFGLCFLGAFVLAQKKSRSSPWLTAAAALLPGAALVFALYLLGYRSVGARPEALFSYLLLADLCLLALVWLEEKLANLQFAAGGAVFLLLGVWTFAHLTNDLLVWGLGGAFGFAILHAALPVVLARRRPNALPAWVGQLFPPAALALTMIPILHCTELSFLVWPCVLLLDLFVVALALVTTSAVAIVVALVLTLAGAGFWLARIPGNLTGLPSGLFLLAGFAVLFCAIGIFLPRLAQQWRGRFVTDAGSLDALWRGTGQPDLVSQLPAMSAITPFLLLIMLTLKLPLVSPSPVFAVALLLVAMALGLTRWLGMDWLPAVGLACVLALEHTWHFGHFRTEAATVPLLWYLGFAGVFTAFPFLFWRKLSGQVVPWAVAALALPLHFFLIHQLVQTAWLNDFMGLLPAACAWPAAAGLIFLLRTLPGNRTGDTCR